MCYTLDPKAEKLFEKITDKYSGQFNLKYSTSSQLSSSQPELDNKEKAEICVRTKATEMIGRLTCVLWVYCNGKTLTYYTYIYFKRMKCPIEFQNLNFSFPVCLALKKL